MAFIMQDNDYCLILAAGFGTRMGEIGKTLPKVMWPLFRKSLLETQVLFAKSLGYKKIYINLFHQADLIKELTKGKECFGDIVWLKEAPDILDIGGGIHNLARQPGIDYKGTLLVLNADQVLWFTESDLTNWKKTLKVCDSVLLCKKVNSSQGYNELETDGNILRGIRLNQKIPRNAPILTYSGNALISLDRLKPLRGPSKFFESICSIDKKNICLDLSHHPYWDFGTKERYFESLKRIVREKDFDDLKDFYLFLRNEKIFDPDCAIKEDESYFTSIKQCINCTSSYLSSGSARGVLMEGEGWSESTKVILKYNDQVDYLN